MRKQTSWTISMLATLTVVTALHAQEGKQDILGLTIGMTRAQANQIIVGKKWDCRKNISPMAGPVAYTCETNLGQMNLELAPNLEGNPLLMIRLFFESADTIENVVESISKQYGKTPSTTKVGFQWQLDNRILRLEKGSKYLLDLMSPTLIEQNDKRAREIELQKSPTPKF